MADVVHKITAEYRQSVDTSQYTDGSPLMWLINPDLSTVSNVPHKYWKVVEDDGVYDVVEMSQEEKNVVDATLQDQANSTIAGLFTFERDGRVTNRWISLGGTKTSDVIPFVSPVSIRISALTFTNKTNGCSTDIQIYKDNTLIFTWEIRNKRVAWKSSGLYNLTFNQGDLIGLYVKKHGNTDPYDVIITLHYIVINNIIGDGGFSTL